MFKLISVNIEHDKHIDRLMPFFERERPDVLYLQEVFEEDFSLMREKFSMEGAFEPYLFVKSSLGSGELHKSGCAILTKLPMRDIKVEYYYGNASEIKTHGLIAVEDQSKVLLSANVEISGKSYRLATTHFTWSADGDTTDRQREDLKKLLGLLREERSLILAGDFNAPRGREIFSELSKHYRDNIPREYTTSVDKNLHRAGDLQLMVDGLFSTEDIEFGNVKLVDGVSDHMAIVAEVK